MRIILLISLILVVLAGCSTTHNFVLTNLKTGNKTEGSYNSSTKQATVCLPSGEVLTGCYSLNRHSAVIAGSLLGQNSAGIFAQETSDDGQAYAVLTGNRGTVMEILVKFCGGSGFGKAQTNRGEVFGVQF